MAELQTIETGKDRPDAPRHLSVHSIHLVRTSQQMQMQLSQMADQKASMLMGAAFVVFTLSMGQIRSGTLFAPFAILTFACFFAAVFAVMTVLPKVTHVHGPVGADDNILFFGIFTGLSEADYIDRVIDRMEDDEAVCRTMLRDVYQNGQVLQRKKYRYLSYAYRIFLVGLVLSFVTFIGEWLTGRF
ncbi:Pycsar system effector family protein [Rhizorhapis sp. SPR117]|uniref:Pycsar system effector family protein n=1 Tax=Rhizorhapis sp. SPR117 TaxID=2912611 RepID=UPI001F328716|nr:DUF5706 domain-containing protein [Rhizorhapis sp. SPR117]